MSEPNRNTLWARAFIEELARAGVRDVCVAPGSRSTPLVLAAAAQPELRMHVHIDERSAAFFALGMGKATGHPAVVLTTSGTAVANLLPAVVEASQSETPLIVLTADRPPRLRDGDANQAIDQVRIFGGYVREFFDGTLPTVDGPDLRHLRTMAVRTVAAALGLPAGVVHVNLPFDKPLEPTLVEGDVPAGFAVEHPRAFSGRGPAVPYTRVSARRPTLAEAEVDALVEAINDAKRGVIVAGPSPDPARAGLAALRLSAAAGLPLVADPLSGARFAAANGAARVGSADFLLKDPRVRDALVPDLILRIGQSPSSNAVLTWLEDHLGVRHIVIDAGRRWKDHLALATDYLQADPAHLFAPAVSLAEDEFLAPMVRRRSPDDAWRAKWSRLDAAASRALADAAAGEFFEGSVLAEVVARIPDGGALFVSNSMPVRDLDAFGGVRDSEMRVLGNRGASGIDGIVSTALGASTAGIFEAVEVLAGGERPRGARTRMADAERTVRLPPLVAVVGDLAFLHDSNGLLATRESSAVVFVVINNDGGGIFHMLPIKSHEPAFTPFFATPHGLDFKHLAEMYRLPYAKVRNRPGLGRALQEGLASVGSRVIEVVSDRESNAKLRSEAERAVRLAVEAVLADGS